MVWIDRAVVAAISKTNNLPHLLANDLLNTSIEHVVTHRDVRTFYIGQQAQNFSLVIRTGKRKVPAEVGALHWHQVDHQFETIVLALSAINSRLCKSGSI